MREKDRERVYDFFRKYEEVCKEHGIVIDGLNLELFDFGNDWEEKPDWYIYWEDLEEIAEDFQSLSTKARSEK